MKVAVFDIHKFERPFFEKENEKFHQDLTFFEVRLTSETAPLARGFSGVCVFAHDDLNQNTLEELKKGETKLLALRSAGFNHVDIAAASKLGFKVVRVPEYSPYAVAEHATALLLALNRKIYRAHERVRELNFSLDGLVGFDLHGKTVGIIGVGKIGSVMARIMHGFGCRVLGYDLTPNRELQNEIRMEYVTLKTLFRDSDVISLHVPFSESTRHLINEATFAQMKKGVYLINTGRGALVDTRSLIQNLKSGRIGAAGLDVYEEEENIFFSDLSSAGIQDDLLARLLTFPNVLITAHQGFLTFEALENIVRTTLQNISDFEQGKPLVNEVAHVKRVEP